MKRLMLLVGVVLVAGCFAARAADNQVAEDYSRLTFQQFTAEAESGDANAQSALTLCQLVIVPPDQRPGYVPPKPGLPTPDANPPSMADGPQYVNTARQAEQMARYSVVDNQLAQLAKHEVETGESVGVNAMLKRLAEEHGLNPANLRSRYEGFLLLAQESARKKKPQIHAADVAAPTQPSEQEINRLKEQFIHGQILMHNADAALKAGKFEEAASLYVQALRTLPKVPAAVKDVNAAAEGIIQGNLGAAREALKKKNAADARKFANAVLALDPDSVEAKNMIILADEAQKRTFEEVEGKALKGDAAAQFQLAWAFQDGLFGIAKDAVESARWYRKAAEQGHAHAQCQLGHCYANGFGLAKDYVEAYKWYNLAATGGAEGPSQFRDALEKTMTPEQIAEAQRLCREFKPKRSDTDAPANKPQ